LFTRDQARKQEAHQQISGRIAGASMVPITSDIVMGENILQTTHIPREAI
jgi:hypothetical protein